MPPTERAPGVPIDRLEALVPALRLAAHRFGTPVAVTDDLTLEASAAALATAFPDPWLRAFSLKANDVTAIVARLAALGLDANVVSRGEWAIATRAGVPNERITLEGIGKTDRDLRAAVAAARAGRSLRWVSIESADEADALAEAARRAPIHTASMPIDVLFRLNPAVAPETHAGLAVGAGGSKFGMTGDELTEAVDRLDGAHGIRARGVHVHVGSQLRSVDAWRDGVRRALSVLALVRGSRPAFDTLDAGGGFPVLPLGEPAPEPARFAREVTAVLAAVPPDRRPQRLAVEPGRWLVARSGWLVARVLHVRTREEGRQVVLDAGMTELIRPALYGAHHAVVALTSMGRPQDGSPAAVASSDVGPTMVEGPLCESTDSFGQHVLPLLQRGDLVAVRDAGAYAASLGSAYNGRPRPPQVIAAAGGSLRLARRRGSLSGLG